MTKPRTTLYLKQELHDRLRLTAKALGIKKSEAIEQSVEQYVERHGLTANGSNAPSQADRLLELAGRFNNPYQHVLAEWRIARAQSQTEHIAEHHFELDVSPPAVYLLRILTAVLTELGEQDEYLVATTPEFWRHVVADDLKRSGGETFAAEYFRAQLRAVGNGMRLCRVFVQDGGDCRAELAVHSNFVRDVQTKLPNHVKNVRVTTRLSEGLRTPIGAFACIRRRSRPAEGLPGETPDEGCLIVEPHYSPLGPISDLRFTFSNGPGHIDARTRDFLERFSIAMQGSVPIDSHPNQ